MIKRQASKDGSVKCTFVLPLEQAPEATSVVGDFNDWDPMATPLKKRSNGTRSASVEVPAGATVQFRYLADGGVWSCDDACEIDDEGNNTFTA